MKKNKLKFWDFFYKNKAVTLKKSSFASFIIKFLTKKNFIIYDAGCGNGRDTNFFNRKKIQCFGIDSSKQIIKKNKLKFPYYKNNFINADFVKFFKKKIKNSFIFYSRFTWHTINYKQEKILLQNLKKNKNLKYLIIEARSINDGLYGKGKKVGKHEYLTDHYRRFIDSKIIIKKISKFLKIIYFKESKNLAKYKSENPCLIRLIAKKK